MPKFCSITPKEQFEENNAEKKKHFLNLFQTLSKISSEFAQKTMGCVL